MEKDPNDSDDVTAYLGKVGKVQGSIPRRPTTCRVTELDDDDLQQHLVSFISLCSLFPSHTVHWDVHYRFVLNSGLGLQFQPCY